MTNYVLSFLFLCYLSLNSKSLIGQTQISQDLLPAEDPLAEKSRDLSGLMVGTVYFGPRKKYLRLGIGGYVGAEFIHLIVSNKRYATTGREAQITVHLLALHLMAKAQSHPSGDIDFGLRITHYLHVDDELTDDSLAMGFFVGPFIQPSFGKNRFRFGFRLATGVYGEWHPRGRGTTTVGIELTPLIRIRL